ncbi:hypothetical protein BASA60_009965 [Batrachochytrium salamandrivorans]|nr:hypothetical protein BASA60_009965 [Batrachochytrium salamandrivorans]
MSTDHAHRQQSGGLPITLTSSMHPQATPSALHSLIQSPSTELRLPDSTSHSISPLPYFKIVVLSSVLFCNTFMATMLLPFLAFMVDSFGIAPKPEDVGTYSGYLVSSFMVGQLLCSYSWGYWSDRLGRRPILITGLMLTGTSFLSFGFSKTYWTALACRFINGSVNGIVGVTMTYMSEITDETNQGSGFAILGSSRASGIILGPLVGGFLSRPVERYPGIFPKGSIFDLFPYSLPCIIGFLVAITGGLLAIAVLQETKPPKLPTNVQQSQTRSDLESHFGDTNECTPEDFEAEEHTESSPLLSSPTSLTSSQSYRSLTTLQPSPTLVSDLESKPEPLTQLLRRAPVALSITLYMLLNSVYIQYDELFALWSRLPPSEGGLGFKSSDQGTIFAIGGVCLMVYQLFIYSWVERRLGTLYTFRMGVLISLPGFGILSFASQFAQSNPSMMWAIVAFAQITRTVGGLQAFTSTFMMTSNSVAPRSRGSVNGFSQACGAFGRMIGPVIAGSSFSWSLQNGYSAPFDYHIMFVMLVLQQVAIFAISLCVSPSINFRVKGDEIETDEVED